MISVRGPTGGCPSLREKLQRGPLRGPPGSHLGPRPTKASVAPEAPRCELDGRDPRGRVRKNDHRGRETSKTSSCFFLSFSLVFLICFFRFAFRFLVCFSIFVFFNFRFFVFFIFWNLLFVHFLAIFGPFGAQKRREELKSISTGPFSALKEPLGPRNGQNGQKRAENRGFRGIEKWSLKPILVVGCSRSGHRLVELVESKTPVFVSKTSKKSEILQRNPSFPRHP